MTEQELQPPAEPAHSGLGIASFVISIAGAVLLIVVIVTAGAIEMSTPGGMAEESAAAILIGLSIMGLLGAEIVALGLGIGGLFQKGRRKIFTILGIVFASAFVVMTGALIAIGLLFG